jgi:hypothetical protein
LLKQRQQQHRSQQKARGSAPGGRRAAEAGALDGRARARALEGVCNVVYTEVLRGPRMFFFSVNNSASKKPWL